MDKKIYLINSETNEIIYEYSNILDWGFNFVEFENYGRCKIYCNDNEYFTDVLPELEVEDVSD